MPLTKTIDLVENARSLAAGYLETVRSGLESLHSDAGGPEASSKMGQMLVALGTLQETPWHHLTSDDRARLLELIRLLADQVREGLKKPSTASNVPEALESVVVTYRDQVADVERELHQGTFFYAYSSWDFDQDVLRFRDLIHYALIALHTVGGSVPAGIAEDIANLDGRLRILLPEIVEGFARKQGHTIDFRGGATQPDMWWRMVVHKIRKSKGPR